MMEQASSKSNKRIPKEQETISQCTANYTSFLKFDFKIQFLPYEQESPFHIHIVYFDIELSHHDHVLISSGCP